MKHLYLLCSSCIFVLFTAAAAVVHSNASLWSTVAVCRYRTYMLFVQFALRIFGALTLCTWMYFEFQYACLLRAANCWLHPLVVFQCAWLLARGCIVNMCSERFDIDHITCDAFHQFLVLFYITTHAIIIFSYPNVSFVQLQYFCSEHLVLLSVIDNRWWSL